MCINGIFSIYDIVAACVISIKLLLSSMMLLTPPLSRLKKTYVWLELFYFYALQIWMGGGGGGGGPYSFGECRQFIERIMLPHIWETSNVAHLYRTLAEF